jgi:hypothetical protein
MTTPTTHRSIATLKLPRQVGVLVSVAPAIVLAMTGNAAFPSPLPSLTAVTAAANDLSAAEATAKARTKGAIATRNQKRAALLTLLEQLRAYVQTVADADRERAANLIQSAGMNVRKVVPRPKRIFLAKQGSISGAVTLEAASAGHRASYEWGASPDAGKTWLPLPPTLQAKTSTTGLTPATTYLFRYRWVSKGGAADWSQPVSLVVK